MFVDESGRLTAVPSVNILKEAIRKEKERDYG